MTGYPKVGATVTFPSGKRAVVSRIREDAIELRYVECGGEVSVSRLFYVRWL